MTARPAALAASWLDRSADGRILRWEPHVLSREMACCGSSWLEAEPSFREAVEVAGQLLATTPIAGGIELATDGWAWLRAAPWPPVGSDPASGGSRDLRPPPRTLRWSDPPFADAFDLTPFDAGDRPGATVRVRRPLRQPYLPFHFDYHHDAPHDRISCRAIMEPATARFEPLYLATLKQTGPHDFELGPAATALQAGAGACASPHDFRGLVAVVGTRDGRRHLLDCRSIFRQHLAPSAPVEQAEWRAASELLRCEPTGDQLWPRRSHDRLAALSGAAEKAGLPAARTEPWPRGTLRWLVLRACGAAPSANESVLRELDAAGDLASLLAVWRPRAFALAARIDDPGARLWILRHDSRADLADLVALAGGGDVATLEAAAARLPVKQQWEALLGQVRPDGAVARLAHQRIRQIEASLRPLAPLADPEAGLAEARAGLAQEASSPLRVGGQPPEGRQRHRDWRDRTELAQAWRARVAAVLAFCEGGSWAPGEPPPAADAAADLLRRARRLAAPPALGEAGDPSDIARLQTLVEQVLHDADHEPASDQRRSIVGELEGRVRPVPERWAAYHAALRRAGTLARAWPGLAAFLGLAADGTGDRARVVLFLQLAGDLRQLLDAAVWSDLLGCASRCAMGELLATPGDPRIGAAHAEAAALLRRLVGAPGLPALPSAPPLRPAAAERRELLAWWRELRALDAALCQLRDRAREQERWARLAQGEARTRLAGGGLRAGATSSRLAGLLAADPAVLTRAEYEELLAAAPLPGETSHGRR
jgi:hypothetical protein